MSWDARFSRRIENDRAVLRVIEPGDRAALARIVFDPRIWDHFVTRVDTEADLHAFMRAALGDVEAGRRVVYVVIDKRSGVIAGSMCYGNLFAADRRLEIGWSWLAPAFQGTGLNSWAKLALLEQAFDRMGAERVEFKTDVLNTPARRALVKIGATEEGVFRSFNVMPGGRRRDAVYYSILRSEWPRARSAIEETILEPT